MTGFSLEEVVLEDKGVAGAELSSVEEVRQVDLGEPLYLLLVLPKRTGSSGDFGEDVGTGEEGGGGEDG